MAILIMMPKLPALYQPEDRATIRYNRSDEIISSNRQAGEVPGTFQVTIVFGTLPRQYRPMPLPGGETVP